MSEAAKETSTTEIWIKRMVMTNAHLYANVVRQWMNVEKIAETEGSRKYSAQQHTGR